MIAQPKKMIYRINVNREVKSLPGEDELDLGLPKKFLQNSVNPNEIFQVFLLLRNGWIEEIEMIKNNGFRFHIGNNQNQMLEKAVQMLRKLLERMIDAPINIYWSSTHIDFIPI